MKKMMLAVLAGVILAGAGCVSTVNERSTAGVPFVKDRVSGRYERPVEPIFQAAKAVITEMGTLINESTLYSEPSAVKTVEGKVEQRSIFIRIEAVDPKVSEVTVQARTRGGGTDLDLAHEIEKDIALRLR
jgi:hypothetical protein